MTVSGRGRFWSRRDGFHVILHVMTKNTSNAGNVRRYRERMRRAGLRLVQLWVPDTRAGGFAEECRRQSLVASANESFERETIEWIDAARDVEGWAD